MVQKQQQQQQQQFCRYLATALAGDLVTLFLLSSAYSCGCGYHLFVYCYAKRLPNIHSHLWRVLLPVRELRYLDLVRVLNKVLALVCCCYCLLLLGDNDKNTCARILLHSHNEIRKTVTDYVATMPGWQFQNLSLLLSFT
ncbi:hypothetical protein GQX74_014789 [Glossina fuscipes]|nr:hypothetical protein GQX74_014789 [Glossina fuscipes]